MFIYKKKKVNSREEEKFFCKKIEFFYKLFGYVKYVLAMLFVLIQARFQLEIVVK